jgi:G3E family GTPase
MPDLTYAQLQKAVTALAKTVTQEADAIRGHARRISEEATDTARVADSIAALKVDTATVAETQQLAKLMDGVSDAALAYAAAAHTTAKSAQAAHNQNKASYSAVGEAVNRSPVGPAIYDVDRTWFHQE